MGRTKRLFFLAVTLLTCMISRGQIVNIETKRMQSDTTGWMGSINGNFSLTKNQDQVFSTDVNAHLQYKDLKNLYLILGNYGFLKGADESFINSSFLHLRYNRKFSNLFRWEVFTQWQNNKVTKIDSRFLFGMGPRFKLASSASFHLYVASLAMYEYEKEISDPVVHNRNLRSSSYVSFTWLPVHTIELTSTTFYQPLFRDFRDYRFLNQATLNFKATRNLSLGVTWSYLYDSRPVPNVPRTNYSLTTGLKYDFGL